MNSLRRNIWAAYLVVGIVLATIIVLAVNQYALSSRYTRLIEQSERTIFGFSTLRELTTEYLLERDWEKLERVIPEIEELNSELARLQENSLIPTEYKLALVDKADLAGVILALRRLSGGEDVAKESNVLQAKMRILSEHLLQLDRIIVSQARGRILNFQMVIIGIMGLLISLATFALNRLHRTTVIPLLSLSSSLQNGQIPELPATEKDVSGELGILIRQIRDLAEHEDTAPPGSKESKSEELRSMLNETVNETINGLNGIINYAQLIADESANELKPDEKELLAKIITSGNDIAKRWQQL